MRLLEGLIRGGEDQVNFMVTQLKSSDPSQERKPVTK